MAKSDLKGPGFSVRVFVPGGDPEGVKIVEKSNWTGSGLVIPRALFPEAKGRAEFGRAGVYLLVGPDESTTLPRLYVGEGDPVRPRLEQHAKGKDFWTHLVVFSSKDQNLNKAHIQYLEARMIGLAVMAKRCVLDNANTPGTPSLSEADAAEAEGYLADMLLCLPVVGYGMFEVPRAATVGTTSFILKSKGIRAIGYESAQGFIVRKGSKAVKAEVKSIHTFLSQMRCQLTKQNVLVDKGEVYEITQDYT
ncbi:MAG: GIY-YIG nuclease family protein, partial [Bacteroidota bacterium]